MERTDGQGESPCSDRTLRTMSEVSRSRHDCCWIARHNKDLAVVVLLRRMRGWALSVPKVNTVKGGPERSAPAPALCGDREGVVRGIIQSVGRYDGREVV